MQRDTDVCPICGGFFLEQPKFASVITITPDTDSANAVSNTPTLPTGVPFSEPISLSQPTAFVSFGQLGVSASKKKKPPKRRPVFLRVFLPALLIVAAVLAVMMVINRPKPTLAGAVNVLLADVKTRADSSVAAIAKPLAECLKNGSISADISYTDDYGDTLSGIVIYASSAETDTRSLSLNALLYGNHVDATLLVGKDYAALGSPALGDAYYGLRFDSFAEDFEKFVDAAGLTEVSYDDCAVFVRLLDSAFNGSGGLTLSESTIAELRVIFTEFFESLPSDIHRVKSFRDGKRVPEFIYTYDITITDIVTFGNRLLGLIKTDDNLWSFLEAYMKCRNIYKHQLSEPKPVELLLDEFENALSYLESSCSGGITARFVTTGGRFSSIDLYSSALTVDGKPQSLGLSLNFGYSINDEWTLEWFNEGHSLRAVWLYNGLVNVPENKLTLLISSNGVDKALVLSSRWNPDTGSFYLSVSDRINMYDVALSGTLFCDDNSFTLALDTAPELSLQLAGKANSDYTAQQEFINLDKWSRDTLELLSRAFKELYNSIYSYAPTDVTFDENADVVLVPR